MRTEIKQKVFWDVAKSQFFAKMPVPALARNVIRQCSWILDYIGVGSEPPLIAPAREPPLWEDGDAQTDDRAQIEPDWVLAAQPAPNFEVDQRINWREVKTAALMLGRPARSTANDSDPMRILVAGRPGITL